MTALFLPCIITNIQVLEEIYYIEIMRIFVTCLKNLEGLLEQELIAPRVKNTKQTVAGVKFIGYLTLDYLTCLWSRLTKRILLLLELAVINAEDTSKLYAEVRKINWLKHIKAYACARQFSCRFCWDICHNY